MSGIRTKKQHAHLKWIIDIITMYKQYTVSILYIIIQYNMCNVIKLYYNIYIYYTSNQPLPGWISSLHAGFLTQFQVQVSEFSMRNILSPTAHEVTQNLLRSKSWEMLRTEFLSNHWLNGWLKRWLNCWLNPWLNCWLNRWLNQCSRKRYLDIFGNENKTHTLSTASLNTGQVRKTAHIFLLSPA